MRQTQIRPFSRRDRDQVTALVNGHIAAVVPGASVSVHALLSHLEREPGEFIVDPWVEERVTIVAEQRDRVVAAAHLLKYGQGQQEITHPAGSDTTRPWPPGSDLLRRCDSLRLGFGDLDSVESVVGDDGLERPQRCARVGPPA